MSFMTADLSNQIPTVMAMLMVISLVGIVGNVLVIIVYMLKHDKLTANLFILVLAASDLLSCSTLVPATICIEYIEWRMQSVVFCKVYYLLNNTFIPFSSLLISCIAFDRYFCLCHPFLRIMTLSRARRVIIILISVSLTIGCSSMFLVRLEKNDTLGNATDSEEYNLESDISANITISDIYECTETTKVNHTTLENMVYQIVQKSQLVSHILCIISVIVLYILIYRSVSKVFQKRAQLKGLHSKKDVQCLPHLAAQEVTEMPDFRLTLEENTLCSPTEKTYCETKSNSNNSPENLHSHKNGMDEIVRSVRLPENQTCSLEVPTQKTQVHDRRQRLHESNTDSPSMILPINVDGEQKLEAIEMDRSKKSIKHLRDTITFQNLKTASMLFVVAVVYIVTFLPAMLMVNGVLKLYLPIFYLYYVNNAINPIVYGFMNPNFRQDIRILFSKRLC